MGANMRFLVLAAGLLCAACQTGVQHQTASGRPEITIPNVSTDRVKSELVNRMVNGGFRIHRDTPYEISFEKPSDNFAVNVLMGSKYDSQPNVRASYTLAQIGSGVRVVGDLAIVTNPNSAFEKRTDMNNSQGGREYQEALDQLKQLLDPNSPTAIAHSKGLVLGINGKPVQQARASGARTRAETGVYVTGVTPNSAAERAGIAKGDVVVELAGKPVSQHEDVSRILVASAGGSVPVTLLREDQEVRVTADVPRVEAAKPAAQRKR
jgi:C-terminal processing protease CtpA/Prc